MRGLALVVCWATLSAGACTFDGSGLPAGTLPGAPERTDAAGERLPEVIDGSPARDGESFDLVADDVAAGDVAGGDVLAAPDQGSPQGAACSSGGVHFVADKAPAAGETIDLTASADAAYAWLMAGVAAGAQPQKLDFSWQAGLQPGDVSCDGGGCAWTFRGVQVPAGPGPYHFGLLINAVDDDPVAGTLLASCAP